MLGLPSAHCVNWLHVQASSERSRQAPRSLPRNTGPAACMRTQACNSACWQSRVHLRNPSTFLKCLCRVSTASGFFFLGGWLIQAVTLAAVAVSAPWGISGALLEGDRRLICGNRFPLPNDRFRVLNLASSAVRALVTRDRDTVLACRPHGRWRPVGLAASPGQGPVGSS